MKAFIKDFDCSDIDDLYSYIPDNPTNFGFWMNFTIGQEGEQWSNNFQLQVATPTYLQEQNPYQSAILLRHTLLVFEYDFVQIYNAVDQYVRSLEEDSWEKLTEKLSRIAWWEYEDYRHL